MANRNLFEDDWRDCLQAHYRFVLNVGDAVNERSLLTVLSEVGFEPDLLREIRITVLGPEAVEQDEVLAVHEVSLDQGGDEPFSADNVTGEVPVSDEAVAGEPPQADPSAELLMEPADEAANEPEPPAARASAEIEDKPDATQLSLF